ncbi:hypothetical protein [Spirillospora sp. NPDC047279]|uniref:relaxase/mobilization nuclease domain-containing protein n=1 Tax=Spirillospora sp. NPDC047279 TaxID=3155478 RepID=UPI0033DE9850
MIAKVMRGERVEGLLRYLFGPGRSNEHVDARLVAGFCSPAELELGGGSGLRRLEGLLKQPLALLGDRNYRKPVWHVAVRAAPEDPILEDGQWAAVAREVMARTGLAPAGDEDAVRWVAVRHADDHIHLVATLARMDGVRPEVWNDGRRVRDACLAVERRFGLRRTAPADRTAARRPKRGENEKANRRGLPEPPRVTLRRLVQVAAAGARSEDEFFERLGAEGVLVRRRFSIRVADEVTGYAVGLPGDQTKGGQVVWYGGGKLAADLTLPKLRSRWEPDRLNAGRPSAGYQPVSGRHLSELSRRAYLRTIVDEVADRVRTAEEFFEALDDAGVQVRCRFSRRDPGAITGYSVALTVQGDDGKVAWYSASRLGDSLAWPRLEQRWRAGSSYRDAGTADLTTTERQALYDDAARAAAYATSHVRRYAAVDPHGARDACRAAADALNVTSQMTRNPHLRRAADAYDRAARVPYGRIPTVTPAGESLRTAARLLTIAGLTGDGTAVSPLRLIQNLITLIEAIAQLHDGQRRRAQAAASRQAGEHLRLAAGQAMGAPAWPGELERSPSALDIALSGFPAPWEPSEAPVLHDHHASGSLRPLGRKTNARTP